MVLLSGVWIFYDYKMLNMESTHLREKHMAEYENLLQNEVNRIVGDINYEKSLTEQRLKKYLKERTNEAYAIARNLIIQNRETLDKINLQKLVKDSLRNIRFQNDRGYYFAFNTRGMIELLPTHPEAEGQALSSSQHNLGQFVFEDALKLIGTAGEGFYSYSWSKPNTPGNQHPKLAYLKYVPELEWIIGTGEYLDDFTYDLQQEICARIEQVRFGKEKNEYIFVATWDGISQSFPAKGKNMLETKDANGKYVVKELMKKAKAGGGFVQYVMPTINNIHSAPKLSYAAPIPEWEWYVGAGVYIDEIDTIIAQNQQAFRDKVLEHIKTMALVLFCLLFINFFTTAFISRSIWKQIELFSQFFRRASTESISMDSEHLVYSEFREISHLANAMLVQKNGFLQKISLSRDEWINTFDAIGDCVFLFDADGNIVRANAVALKLHEKPLDELVNRHFSSVCSPENPVHQTLSDQKPHSAEVNNKLLNKMFLASSFPIFTREGQLHRTILIARDITEEKRLKAQLAQSQKMEAIGLLASGVAHDLNNILSGVVSYPDLIIPQLPKNSPLKKQILAIQKSGQQAAEIVADLLTLTRGITASKKVIDLNALILEHLESPESEKVQKVNPLLSLSTNLDTALLHCCCSPVHIKKSLLNLIMNAAEAIKDDGQITITTCNLEIEAAKAKELHINRGKYVVLKIADSGSGISAVDLERIFEPFYTKKVMGNSGSGLGLSIVWNSIKDHEGAVEVTSNSNGTEFAIYLPGTEDQIPKEDKNPDLLDLKGHGESILIVDDDALQRDIATNFTEILGYKAKAVESGEKALDYLADNRTDLIILDMILDNGMNGRETYERIIQMYPEQNALIVSGYSLDSEVKQVQAIGAGQYVKKPYTINQLGLAIRAVFTPKDLSGNQSQRKIFG